MKILLAPSKTQNIQDAGAAPCRKLLNRERTIKLFTLLQSETKEGLGEMLKIKGELLEETWRLYQDFTPENPGIQAIDCYKGVVFGGLECSLYDTGQRDYMNDHLRILSAMYGIITPETRIWPYRLDMTNKPGGMNLYRYWKDDVADYFRGEDLIINLSSTEYSKMLSGGGWNMLNLHFMERKPDGSMKAVSFNAKKARGRMANLIIRGQVEDVRLLKRLEPDGYHFLEGASDDCNYVYVR